MRCKFARKTTFEGLARKSGDLFLELSEEVEGVKGRELVEIGVPELVEDGAIEGGEEDFLVAIAAVRGRGRATCRSASRV
jgi:hypothetical protein